MLPGNEAGPSCNGEHDAAVARRLAPGSPRPSLGREDTSILEALQCLPERLCATILNDVATGELDELGAEVVGEAAAVFHGREAIVLS